jgi:hypothetical protein
LKTCEEASRISPQVRKKIEIAARTPYKGLLKLLKLKKKLKSRAVPLPAVEVR